MEQPPASPGQGPEEPAVGMVKTTAPKEASHPRGRWPRSSPPRLRGPCTLPSPSPSLHLVTPPVIFPGFSTVLSELLMAHPISRESPHRPALPRPAPPQLLLPSLWRHLSLLALSCHLLISSAALNSTVFFFSCKRSCLLNSLPNLPAHSPSHP